MKIVSASRIVLSAAVLLAGSMAVAEEKPEAEKAAALTIGSKAPALDIEHWVSDGNGQFPPVTEFEPGKIYVVEFWATWCGPCISSMPHLVELQTNHAKDGVQVVSISKEDLETVNKFLERKYTPRGKAAEGEDQPATYGELTSAYCLTTDPDSSCSVAYMKAAGQNGIPCCFLVGKTGQIEWIGHPMSLDETLKAVIADKWDREQFAKEFTEGQKIDLAIREAGGLIQSGDFDKAVALFEGLKANASGNNMKKLDFYIGRVKELQLQAMVENGEVDEAIKMIDEQIAASKDGKMELQQQKFTVLMTAEKEKEAAAVLEELIPQMSSMELNQIAWTIYETAAEEDSEVAAELVQAALAAAEKAVKDDAKNAPVLDTLAHLLHLTGNLERAIEVQTNAVKHQDPPNEDIDAFLKTLKEEKDGKKDE